MALSQSASLQAHDKYHIALCNSQSSFNITLTWTATFWRWSWGQRSFPRAPRWPCSAAQSRTPSSLAWGSTVRGWGLGSSSSHPQALACCCGTPRHHSETATHHPSTGWPDRLPAKSINILTCFYRWNSFEGGVLTLNDHANDLSTNCSLNPSLRHVRN